MKYVQIKLMAYTNTSSAFWTNLVLYICDSRLQIHESRWRVYGTPNYAAAQISTSNAAPPTLQYGHTDLSLFYGLFNCSSVGQKEQLVIVWNTQEFLFAAYDF